MKYSKRKFVFVNFLKLVFMFAVMMDGMQAGRTLERIDEPAISGAWRAVAQLID